jgi:hypothetical protein
VRRIDEHSKYSSEHEVNTACVNLLMGKNVKNGLFSEENAMINKLSDGVNIF